MEEKKINLMPEETKSNKDDVVSYNKEIDSTVLHFPEKKDKLEKNISKKSFLKKGKEIFSNLTKKKQVDTSSQKINKEEAFKNFKISGTAEIEKEIEKEIAKPKSTEPEEKKPEEKKPEEKKDNFSLPPENDVKFHAPKPLSRAKLVTDEDSGVDLIPASAKIRNWNQINSLLSSSFLISLFIVMIFFGSLVIFERSLDIERETTTQEIYDIEDKLLSFEDTNNEIKELGKNILLAHNALGRHIYWTNFFELLEKYTLEDVIYKGFAAGMGGEITIDAVGINFDSVAKQLKILEQSENFITDVKVYSGYLTEEGVEFPIILSLDPQLFYYKEY